MRMLRHRLIRHALIVLLLVMLLMLFAVSYPALPRAQAASTTMTLGATTCSIGSTSLTAGPAGDYVVVYEIRINGVLVIGPKPSALSRTYAAGETFNGVWIGNGGAVSGDTVQFIYTVLEPESLVATLTFVCIGGVPTNIQFTLTRPQVDAASPPPPPGIWLSDVCEPFDGFSGDGWTTVGSNAASLPWGTALYVAASAEGPWYATEFYQPPYIINQSQLDALAAMVGAPTREAVWMKASAVGSPANYGSMVADRAAHMEALCGN